jgi:hypothetical protein
MSSLQNRLDRLEAFFERENDLHDEILRGRPTWWHVGKIALGVAFVGRSVAIALKASGVGGYALAVLMFAGGAYLAYEGFAMLRERRRIAKVS